MTARPVVLYHAMGGGLGHGTRALAVARQLVLRIGGQHHIIASASFAQSHAYPLSNEPNISVCGVQGNPAQVSKIVESKIRELSPNLWIIDTFPRGVVGELREIQQGWSGCPRVLVARGLPLAYVSQCRVYEWVRRHFDLILQAGEPSPFAELGNAVCLPPFFVRDREELLSVPQALARLLADEPAILFVATYDEFESEQWIAEAEGVARSWPADGPPLRVIAPPNIPFRLRSAVPLVRYAPLLECMPGARLVLGNAGYNLVQETRYVGVPGLFLPQPRQYDRQSARLRPEELLHGSTLQCIEHRLKDPISAPEQPINGAALAAQRIAEMFF
jgi:hypothetical protein